MSRLKELLKLAEQQIGYQEKASAAMLDDPHGNAGYNNYTKYARDVNNWGPSYDRLPGKSFQMPSLR